MNLLEKESKLYALRGMIDELYNFAIVNRPDENIPNLSLEEEQKFNELTNNIEVLNDKLRGELSTGPAYGTLRE